MDLTTQPVQTGVADTDPFQVFGPAVLKAPNPINPALLSAVKNGGGVTDAGGQVPVNAPVTQLAPPPPSDTGGNNPANPAPLVPPTQGIGTPTDPFTGFTASVPGWGKNVNADQSQGAQDWAAKWKAATTGSYTPGQVDVNELNKLIGQEGASTGSTFDYKTGTQTGNDPVYALQAKVQQGGTLTPTELAFLSTQGTGTGEGNITGDFVWRHDANKGFQYAPDLGVAAGFDAQGNPIDKTKSFYDQELQAGGITAAQAAEGDARIAAQQAQAAIDAAAPKAVDFDRLDPSTWGKPNPDGGINPSGPGATGPAAANPDPFGQFDLPTSKRPVITPQYEAMLANQPDPFATFQLPTAATFS